MNFRTDSLYVSSLVRKGLNYIPKTEQFTSPDAIANYVLETFLRQEWPLIVKHIEEQQDRDKAFREQMNPQKHEKT